MHGRNWMVLLVAACTALAGCMGDGDESQGGGDGADDTNGTTDGGAGDGGTGSDGAGGNETEATIAGLTLLTMPESATAGEEVVVCWHVEGAGTVPHVAVHWDTESHTGDDVTFQDYAGGLAWPDNATEPAEEGYALPGDFCTSLVAPDDADEVFFRAHAMVEPPGELSDEGSFTVDAA